MQPVSTDDLSRRERPFRQHTTRVNKGPSVALKALHDEPLAAEQTHADPLLEGNPDTYTFCRSQKRVLLRNQLAAKFGQMYGNDFPRVRCAEGDVLLLRALVEKHRHEERFAGEQPLPRSHKCTDETTLLLRAVTENRLHLVCRLLLEQTTSFRDRGFFGVQFDFHELHVVA